MEQYIKKSALVAEMERRIKERDIQMKQGCWVSYTYMYEDILDFIDTLEVKEVNLEKELDEWMKYGPHTNYPWCTIPDAIRIAAEHFYELGLKAQKGEK